MHSLVIRNGTVVTMNERREVIAPGYVAVDGDTIVEVGEGPASPAARDVLDAGGGLILPGLVNTHTHAAMTIFRGLADDLPLMEWLTRYIFPVERSLSGEWVYWGTCLAAMEMIRTGTTTFCDMYLFEDRVAEAARAAGMRALVGEVLYDFESPSYGALESGLEATRRLIEQWKDDPLISVAVQPHSTYTCSPDLFRRVLSLSQDTGVPIVTHLSESQTEVDTVLERYGRRPVAHLEALGILEADLIADHCVILEEAEMDLLAERGVRVSHNAESNMKLACGVAPVPLLKSKGVCVGLGTDGCASNNNLNLFGEMDMVAKLHKVVQNDPTVMDARTVFSMATCEGARVLGMEDQIGSIQVGKKADLVVLDGNRSHMIPMYNPYSNLVYAADGSEVTATVIAGRPVFLNGEVLTMDEREIQERVRGIARQILEQLHEC